SQCELGCQQACGGTCTANIARPCELDCQAQLTSVCAPEMASSCTDECGRGAVLMCDGQYVHASDVNACIAALEHEGVSLSGPVAAFDSEQIFATALESASCSVADESNDLRVAGVLFGLFSLGLGASFVRRRRAA
ncbi:MAG TPA: MYXO-CTERM sorting domain-containing protein, partial [Enhygromyxa sp.]|nr:MYXO-CTERM sorting domain-containing protein [Enhygromyxa sp.]